MSYDFFVEKHNNINTLRRQDDYASNSESSRLLGES